MHILIHKCVFLYMIVYNGQFYGYSGHNVTLFSDIFPSAYILIYHLAITFLFTSKFISLSQGPKTTYMIYVFEVIPSHYNSDVSVSLKAPSKLCLTEMDKHKK